MSRGKRLYLPISDAEEIAVLVIETEDRSDREQEALVRLCSRLDGFERPCPVERTWASAAELSREPGEETSDAIAVLACREHGCTRRPADSLDGWCVTHAPV